MHKIDLLKGQGIPAKTTSGGIMVLAVTLIVPILVAAGGLDWYLRTKMRIEVQEGQIVKAKQTISELAPDVRLKKSKEREIALVHSKLTEVSRCLNTFMQWSPILETLAEYMPTPMIMNDLTAQNTSGARRTTRRSNDPNQPLSIPVPDRTLVMNISGDRAGNFNPIVQKFQESLNSSEALKPRLTNIVHSRQAGIAGAGQRESHEMKIIFASESNE